MHHVFSDIEGLRIAVEMERRGEDFYRRAARVSRTQETVALLNALADDETMHCREFQRLHDIAVARKCNLVASNLHHTMQDVSFVVSKERNISHLQILARAVAQHYLMLAITQPGAHTVTPNGYGNTLAIG